VQPIEQQIILVTGATDGLGRAVARELAGQGATVLLHGRSAERAQRTLAEIEAQTGNHKLTYYRADFESLSEVRRIVNVASAGQAPINFDDIMLERSYDGTQAYCQAKLADVMLTIDQAAELSGTGVTVNCVHPAFNMPTKIVTPMFTPQSEIADGVRSTARLISDPALDNVTGRYFDETQEARALPEAYDERARARLRAVAEQLTGVSRHRSRSAPD
jgi:NAD(P)-dependent dehydrogenase (short-subunit alcohol dehydrogenase family)